MTYGGKVTHLCESNYNSIIEESQNYWYTYRHAGSHARNVLSHFKWYGLNAGEEKLDIFYFCVSKNVSIDATSSERNSYLAPLIG